ncbi:MAG: hypothetical protein ACYC7L_00455 [Nitrospirota bacterium]
MNTIVNLVSVVVGSLSTALGMSIVSRQRHREQLVEKNKEIKREKVELMVLRALELQDWLLTERDYRLYKKSQPEGSCPINDVAMIASLYASECSGIADRLRVVVLDFRTWIAKASLQVQEKGNINEESSNDFMQIGMRLHSEVQNLVKYGASLIKELSGTNK